MLYLESRIPVDATAREGSRMFNIIVAVVLVITAIAVIAVIVKYNAEASEVNARIEEMGRGKKVDKLSLAWSLIPLALAAVTFGLGCFYAQDIGEAVVIRNFGGSLAGHTTEAGFHAKMPWQDVTSWDIRNRLINLYRDNEYKYDNGSYDGATVTVNDQSGTKADVDVQVIYSIDADYVEQLYAEYGTQEAYVSNYVSNDVRQTVRDCAGGFSTIQLLTDRDGYAKSIQDALSERWEGKGVIVESVQVQDVRYAQSITDAYANAQTAEIEKQRALNAQETAKVEAETKKIEAQGEADANRVLTESLTPEVLQQLYYETLKSVGSSGNLVLLPEGSTPIVNTTK